MDDVVLKIIGPGIFKDSLPDMIQDCLGFSGLNKSRRCVPTEFKTRARKPLNTFLFVAVKEVMKKSDDL